MSAPPELLLAGWPVAASLALAVVRGRRRRGRSRMRANRALHELRRPLQVLALGAEAPFAPQVEQAIAALGDLDAALNGGAQGLRRELLDLRLVVEDAADRWGAVPGGARVGVRWRAADAHVLGDRARIGQALDNLLANALEHGGGAALIECTICARGIRIAVCSRGAHRRSPGRPSRRRGHGLAVVAEVAAAHGGEATNPRREGGGTMAAIVLPLASAKPPQGT